MTNKNTKKTNLPNLENKIEIYQSEDNRIQIQTRLERETIWLTQKQMSELFGKDTDTIGLHLKNIFEEDELDE
ncbi:MAG: hypothetical protein ACKN9I_05795, partial [Alphaproteobacteria bacterium]